VSSDFISISKLIRPFLNSAQSSKDCDTAVNTLAFPARDALRVAALTSLSVYPSIRLSAPQTDAVNQTDFRKPQLKLDLEFGA